MESLTNLAGILLYRISQATYVRESMAIILAKSYSELYLKTSQGSGFYPRDAMLERVFATATCPSVCLSVCHTPVLCLAERKQDREMYTA